jgi:hypothetical protein
MKISEMIKNLQYFMKEFGDVDCFYAVDDEGNDYKEIHYAPSPFYVDGGGDVYAPEEIDDYEGFELEVLELVCVVN